MSEEKVVKSEKKNIGVGWCDVTEQMEIIKGRELMSKQLYSGGKVSARVFFMALVRMYVEGALNERD